MSKKAFRVSLPGVKNPLLDKPWRDEPWEDKEDDSDFVKNYTPQSEAQHIRVLLVGSVGSGKSSFIDSVDSALRKKIAIRASVATGYHYSYTKEYRTYKIQKEKHGTFYRFVLSDTMGIEKGSDHGIDVKNIKLIMEGHINEGCKLLPGSTPTGPDYNETPTINDKVHVLVFVVDANKIDMMDDDSVCKMKDVRDEGSALRIPQIAIVTKIDEACSKVQKDIKNVYKSKILKKLMEKLSVNLGIPTNCIFPVKNYSIETKTKDDINTLLMNTMRKIIDFGEDFLNDVTPAEDTKQPEKPEQPVSSLIKLD